MSVNLTKKQKLFCDEYLIDLNATRSYKAAGYSVKSKNAAGVEGFKLLKNPKIDLYLRERIEERQKRTEITQDKVIQELAKVGLAKLENYLEYKTVESIVEYKDGKPVIDYRPIINLIDSEQIDTSAIQEVSVSKDGTFKFKLHDKLKALELLGKHLKIFDERNLDSELNKVDELLSEITKQAKE